jgi:iron complex transport system ATP-binding protein
MLQAHDIHFCIQNRPIVDKASMILRPGELTVILGPNGAGKSSLFKVLSGEQSCKHGKVSYNGRSLDQFKNRQLAQVRSVMPQHSSLTFPFSVLEVVELGLLSLRKYSSELLQEVMEQTHTWELRDSLYGNLSGGEKQRVQLARVLTQIWEKKPFPRYLLLDEPTSSMDIALQHHVLSIIQKIKERNIGVLAILHDLNLAANYADQVILMKKGHILFQGNTQEVMNADKLMQVFDHPIEVYHGDDQRPTIIQSVPFKNINNQIKQA